MAKKETVTLGSIKADFNKIEDLVFDNVCEWRIALIFSISFAAVLLGISSYFAFNNVWAGVILFLVPLYHIVRLFISLREHRIRKKAIAMVSKREDISVFLECFSHVSQEQIYEPHWCFHRIRCMKTVKFLNFRSFKRWRAWVTTLYEWSEELYMSGDMVEKISLPDDELFCVSLQGFEDISCVYPSKFFIMDKNLF